MEVESCEDGILLMKLAIRAITITSQAVVHQAITAVILGERGV